MATSILTILPYGDGEMATPLSWFKEKETEMLIQEKKKERGMATSILTVLP